MWLLEVLLLLTFALIFIQDFRSRLVYWFLYPLVGLLCFFIQTSYNTYYSSLVNSAINFLFVGIILLVSFLYSYFRLKKIFLREVFGLGDVLFFIAVCFSFATLAFLVFLVFALCFSLVAHLVLKSKSVDKTVPLAGYMSLFFGVVYLLSFLCNAPFLYSY